MSERDGGRAELVAQRLRLGILASHAGTTMQAIIDACLQGRLHADVRVVIGNNSHSGALARAQSARHPDRTSQQRNSPKRSRPRPRDHGNAGWSPSRRRGARRVHEAARVCWCSRATRVAYSTPTLPCCQSSAVKGCTVTGCTRPSLAAAEKVRPARVFTWLRVTTTQGLSCRRSRSRC